MLWFKNLKIRIESKSQELIDYEKVVNYFELTYIYELIQNSSKKKIV